jgi:hypothetical protein
MRSAVALILAFAISPAFGDFVLTGLTYQDYCPPAAIRSGLCDVGEAFVADEFIGAPAKVGEYYVNQMTQDGDTIYLGSRIQVPYIAYRDGKPIVRHYSYTLVDGWVDTSLCSVIANPETVATTITGRTVDVETSKDGCTLSVRSVFTEPQSYPRVVTHEATMTFVDSACSQE